MDDTALAPKLQPHATLGIGDILDGESEPVGQIMSGLDGLQNVEDVTEFYSN